MARSEAKHREPATPPRLQPPYYNAVLSIGGNMWRFCVCMTIPLYVSCGAAASQRKPTASLVAGDDTQVAMIRQDAFRRCWDHFDAMARGVTADPDRSWWQEQCDKEARVAVEDADRTNSVNERSASIANENELRALWDKCVADAHAAAVRARGTDYDSHQAECDSLVRQDSERREQERQNQDRVADKTQRLEHERRDAEEPAIKRADEQWPVEEQPSAETRAKDYQIAIGDGAVTDDAATKAPVDANGTLAADLGVALPDDARTKAAVDKARAEYKKRAEEPPPACSTLESIELVNGLMDRERGIEQESGVVDLSAKRKYGGMLVALKGQLAAQKAAFKSDTGRAFDRKRDCVEQPVANESNVDTSESVCGTFDLIEIYNGQMKQQRAIERESGVEDLAAKRRIGEALALAKSVQAKALADFKRRWKRSFKRATDCATPP